MLNLLKKLFWIILICNEFAYGQKKTGFLIGLDAGYIFLPSIADSRFISNINFMFYSKHFLIKTHTGIAPSKNFNNIYIFGIDGGFTTNIEKIVSFNVLLGITGFPERFDGYNRINGGKVSLVSGIYFNPFKNKNLLFGINGMTSTYSVYEPGGNYKAGRESGGIYGSINFSFLYKFNIHNANK